MPILSLVLDFLICEVKMYASIFVSLWDVFGVMNFDFCFVYVMMIATFLFIYKANVASATLLQAYFSSHFPK